MEEEEEEEEEGKGGLEKRMKSTKRMKWTKRTKRGNRRTEKDIRMRIRNGVLESPCFTLCFWRLSGAYDKVDSSSSSSSS